MPQRLTREVMTADILTLGKTFPIAMVREFLSYAFHIPVIELQDVGRDLALQILQNAGERITLRGLKEIHFAAYTGARNGVKDWLIGGKQQLTTGKTPFNILLDALESSGVDNFDELEDLRKQYELNPGPYRRNADDKLRALEREWISTRSDEAWGAYRNALDRTGRDICDECEAVVDKETITECDCATPICSNCGLRCNNCEELRCEECARVCFGCEHKHILCEGDCNADDEFMRKCDECEKWFCRQCHDDCFREHEDDCYE